MQIETILTDGIVNGTQVSIVANAGLSVMENLTDMSRQMTSGDLNNAVDLMQAILDMTDGTNVQINETVTLLNM